MGAASENFSCFFETAILKESGMESLADCIWTVDAPAELRIERVMKRNNMDYDAVKKADGQPISLGQLVEAGFPNLQ